MNFRRLSFDQPAPADLFERLHPRPRLLDLFCGAGGCSVGYDRAGFDVVGVDIEPHHSYPFMGLLQDDAMLVLQDLEYLREFDAIHASPPCQAYSVTQSIHGTYGKHPELLRTWGPSGLVAGHGNRLDEHGGLGPSHPARIRRAHRAPATRPPRRGARRMTSIRLPWPTLPLSQNQLRRMHHHAEASTKKRLLAEARTAIRAAGPEPMAGAIVILHWLMPDRRKRDGDGAAPTLKVVLDALVHEGVIPDDSWIHVPHSGVTCHPPMTGCAGRMWVTLTDPDREAVA